MERKHNCQIVPETGVTADYWNQFAGRPIIMFGNFSPGVNWASLVSYPIKKYQERYLDKFYDDVITPKNHQRVKRLDEIVDEVNALASPERFSMDRFVALVKEAAELIYGKPIEIKPKDFGEDD